MLVSSWIAGQKRTILRRRDSPLNYCSAAIGPHSNAAGSLPGPMMKLTGHQSTQTSATPSDARGQYHPFRSVQLPSTATVRHPTLKALRLIRIPACSSCRSIRTMMVQLDMSLTVTTTGLLAARMTWMR
jgi:hypothetical protein